MKKILLLSMLLVVFSACGGGDDGGSSPEISKDYLNVAPNIELLGDGQTVELTIDANCNWTITKDADWLSVSPMSGTNKLNVSITAGKNNTGSSRTAVLSVKGGSKTRNVTVTQGKSSDSDTPIDYSLATSTLTLSFENTGGSQTFTIASNTNWTISAPDWCTVSPSSGKDNATITASAKENDSTEQRTRQITINGEGVNPVIISVKQTGKDNTPHEPGSDDNLPPS